MKKKKQVKKVNTFVFQPQNYRVKTTVSMNGKSLFVNCKSSYD